MPYLEHCKVVNDDELDRSRRDQCLASGINPEQHCCLQIAYYISRPVECQSQGPNRVLDWIAPWNEYRIPVSYDGNASTLISFCPWCAAKLPESRRDLWYKTLYELGYTDPSEQNVPEEFNSDMWWRKRGI
jgi:hypothetical protein